MIFDTHAHIDFEDFDCDRDSVIERALGCGVSYIINPGCDPETSAAAVDLAEKYECVLAAAGVHPNNTAFCDNAGWEKIKGLASHPRVVALGETGLDFYRDRSPVTVQIEYFRRHLIFAKEISLPVIVHFRDVGFDGIERTGPEYFDNVKGVFHCFGGSPELAEKLVSMGFYIGFDGPLTYKNSDRIPVAETVPTERCLIETDSPFLSPKKFRGSRNEPSYVLEIAEELARIKKMDVEEIIEITGGNALRLFGSGTK